MPVPKRGRAAHGRRCIPAVHVSCAAPRLFVAAPQPPEVLPTLAASGEDSSPIHTAAEEGEEGEKEKRGGGVGGRPWGRRLP
jgi:hypothetical protein